MAPHGNEVCSLQYFREQSQEFLPVWFLVSVVHRRDDGGDHGSRKSAVIPGNLAMGVRTLTSNIVMEMGYATDLHREALIATAVVLFVLILIINLCCSALQRRSGQ